MIGADWDVPLPRRTGQDPSSYDSFISLCELAVIQNRFLSISTRPGSFWDSFGPSIGGKRTKLSDLSAVALELSVWRHKLDNRRFFERPPEGFAPGVCELA